MSKNIPTKINNYNVYNEGEKLLGVGDELTLPDFEATSETVSGAGILGLLLVAFAVLMQSRHLLPFSLNTPSGGANRKPRSFRRLLNSALVLSPTARCAAPSLSDKLTKTPLSPRTIDAPRYRCSRPKRSRPICHSYTW